MLGLKGVGSCEGWGLGFVLGFRLTMWLGLGPGVAVRILAWVRDQG